MYHTLIHLQKINFSYVHKTICIKNNHGKISNQFGLLHRHCSLKYLFILKIYIIDYWALFTIQLKEFLAFSVKL